jgi:trehalose 6-phosphate synthase
MSRIASFIIALIVALAALTAAVAFVVRNTVQDWFRRDLNLQAQVVVRAAQPSLVAAWGFNTNQELEKLLGGMMDKQRLVAAAACSSDLELLAWTPDYPSRFGCSEVADNLIDSGGALLPWRIWQDVQEFLGSSVHLSAIPIEQDGHALGFVVLVHDLSYMQRRNASTRTFLLIVFGFLSVATAGITIAVARFSRRGWSTELRKILQGRTSQKAEFQPILRDVRELVNRLIREREAEGEGGIWTAQRLKHVLGRLLHGEKVVIVANREPYIHQWNAEGAIEVVHPASGLVTALEPVMRACSGVWIAHGSGSADRDTVDKRDRVLVPPGEQTYSLRRVWLTREEEERYYYGFSNEGLWPLCHIAHTRPVFRAEDWLAYRRINERFADAVVQEADSKDPIVLVQDYHFALAPLLIRERLPRAAIISFLHTPWPNAERFGICPYRDDLLNGLLGSSILGFHTQQHCINFLDAVDHFLESRIDREQNAVVQGGHKTLIRPYPISLEWPVRWLNSVPSVEECRRQTFTELGLRPNTLLGVGVDRLDYTKGIEERLLAVERLLERFPEYRGRFVFAQLAAPSRTKIEQYRHLNDAVEHIAARINERFGTASYKPMILARSHHEPPTVYRYYRAADLCYVSSLHDGMNLVAKEFIAARDDEHGVLILSQFTGAAREMTEALIVNPYDLEEASSALAAALMMSPEEQRVRVRAMRAYLSEYNVYRWAGKMLTDAARLRSHERLEIHLASRAEVGSPVS